MATSTAAALVASALVVVAVQGHGAPRHFARPGVAGVTNKTVDYVFEGKPYQGYYAFPTSRPDPSRPMTGVIVGHQWMGLGDMERYRCDQLAAAGYFAFALDVYGKGVRPTTVAEAQGNVSAVEKNLTDFHAKLRHAVEMVKGFGLINQTHMFANGYCFGGEMVLELARLGVPEVKGVASFHGELGNLTAQSSDKITAVVQVHHADLDFQHAQGLLDFEDEMRNRSVAYWTTSKYGNCEHGWTDPTSQNYRPFEAKEAHDAMFSLYARLL